jgi:small subunit ribosomal protein S16
MRLGKIRAPYYRIVVADSRTKRDGRVIETIGKYHPKEDPSFIEVDSERAQYWLGVGAQPTEPVAAILKVTGDWQKFKGLPAPEQGLKTAAAKPDRKAIFEAAAKETLEDAPAAKKATTPKKTAKKAAEASEAPAADEAPSAEVTPDDQPAGTADAPAPVEEAADAAATPDPDARPETSGDEPVETPAAADSSAETPES